MQQAAKLALEPIFEADFLPSSYGFRPRRSATQALERIRVGFIAGRRSVSYTHLDVYKRQRKRFAEYSRTALGVDPVDVFAQVAPLAGNRADNTGDFAPTSQDQATP